MAIDSGPRTATAARASRAWRASAASVARAVRDYPRRNPLTFAYLLVILAGLLVMTKVLSGPAADHFKIAISTDPHNMAHAPLTVLLASPVFAATDSGVFSHLLIIGGGVGVCMAALERRIGALRTVALFLLANSIATAVATSVAAAAIHSGRYPAKWWDGYDYGISYGVLAIAASVTPLVTPLVARAVASLSSLRPLRSWSSLRSWSWSSLSWSSLSWSSLSWSLPSRIVRLLWIAGVFAYPFVSAQWFGLLPNFATIGHETAAAFGLAAGYYLLRGDATDRAVEPDPER
ncbi:rhomboid-like protein [Catenulispora pinisilvae]|uniref:rhomboid-like protein n=1 Tax=Catenulispora pinisilvae TaxID=2705253 RepID=UPI001891F52D|nr:rhomboid-like protein [Catenulispora pinisilvae]